MRRRAEFRANQCQIARRLTEKVSQEVRQELKGLRSSTVTLQIYGGPCRTRTYNQRIKRPILCNHVLPCDWLYTRPPYPIDQETTPGIKGHFQVPAYPSTYPLYPSPPSLTAHLGHLTSSRRLPAATTFSSSLSIQVDCPPPHPLPNQIPRKGAHGRLILCVLRGSSLEPDKQGSQTPRHPAPCNFENGLDKWTFAPVVATCATTRQ